MSTGIAVKAVSRQPGRPKGESRLSRDVILATAIELSSTRSTDAASVRGIAARLGVSPMAIYNHVGGKAEIERHVLAHLFKTEAKWSEFSAETPGAQILREILTAQYKLSLRYPDIFSVFTHNSTMSEVLRLQEQLYEGLRRCGIHPAMHRLWARILGSFVIGSAALHSVASDAAWEQHEAAYSHLDQQLYPNLVSARATNPDPDALLFATELDCLIDALLLAAGDGGGNQTPLC